MNCHVFKRKRKVNGKTVSAQNYTGRYKLKGETRFIAVNLGVTDRQVAEKKLREIALQEERERAGLAVTKTECACMNAPLSDLLGDFVSEKEQLGRASEYTRHISARVLALVKECGWQCLRDVNADSFRKWRKGKAASAKTLNEYQNAVVALLNWVGKTKGVKVSVFDSVEHIDARGRKSFERRALTAPEARALLACSPLQRRVAYALALFTGLRRGEIEALEWRDLSLDGEHPFVSVRASTTKNSKPARLPLHSDLVAVLREWRKADCDACDLVLPNGIALNHKGLWGDLETAGIVRMDASGRKVDFHALRHTLCTLLQASGASPRVAMEIMRHNDIRLTVQTYTDGQGLPTGDAISKLPSLFSAENLTQDLTHALVKNGQSVSKVVAFKNGTSDVQPVCVQSVVADCHNLSAFGAMCDVVPEGGLEPPHEFNPVADFKSAVSAISPLWQKKTP